MTKKIFIFFIFAFSLCGSMAFADNQLSVEPSLSNQRKTTRKTSAPKKQRQYKWNTSKATMVEPECLIDASQKFKVPLSIILTVLDVERGSVGMWAGNSNKTGDLGPMQINTIHIPRLSEFGISKTDLQTNGCLNIHVGTWLLKKHLEDSHNNVIEAIGRYHSYNQPYKSRYQKLAVASYKRLRKNPKDHIKKVLDKSNEIFIKRELAYVK